MRIAGISANPVRLLFLHNPAAVTLDANMQRSVKQLAEQIVLVVVS